MTTGPKHSIGKEKAIALANSGWWKDTPHREIAEFQLMTAELCVPFGVFHEAVEKSLGRPVWTHEFALNYEGIMQEFLGQRPAPTFDEILNLIPEEAR